MLHLLFVKIHPLYDGNGRKARLLEKWFLVTHLGKHAWHIEVERYYHQHLNDYYKTLRILGIEYASLDYSKALPFTQLLIKSLEI
jgi:Fic family protein